MKVIGYHGTTKEGADGIRSGTFKQSENPWDWMGFGAYFWLDAPTRAFAWAKELAKRKNSSPIVVKAEISLNHCLDLTDTRFNGLLRMAFLLYAKNYLASTEPVIKQEPLVLFRHPIDDVITGLTEPWYPADAKFGRNRLDCKIANLSCIAYEDHFGNAPWSLRASFTEGYPFYFHSFFHSRSHVQIAVRETTRALSNLEFLDERSMADVELELVKFQRDIENLKVFLKGIGWKDDNDKDSLYHIDEALAKSRDNTLDDAAKTQILAKLEKHMLAMSNEREKSFFGEVKVALASFLR
jgi:hypothetical protein